MMKFLDPSDRKIIPNKNNNLQDSKDHDHIKPNTIKQEINTELKEGIQESNLYLFDKKGEYSDIMLYSTSRPLEIINDIPVRYRSKYIIEVDPMASNEDLAKIIRNHPEVKYLSLHDCYNIDDFSPIESLSGLEELNLAGCLKLKNISFISNFKSLKVLNISRCPITNFQPLSNLSSLLVLCMKYCIIKDISVIKDLVNLRELVLYGCGALNDISSLQNLKKITSLDLDTTNVNDISVVRNFENLNTLILTSCRVPDISAIANLKQLRVFIMNHDMMLSPSQMKHFSLLVNLKILILKGLTIGDLEPLRNLVNLIELRLNTNKISNVEPLSNMTKLEILDLSNNSNIKDISCFSRLTNLKKLLIGGNKTSEMKIERIDVLKNLTNLRELDISYNQYIRDISPIANIITLESFVASHCINLEVLYPLKNLVNIIELDISFCPKIRNLFFIKYFKNISMINIIGISTTNGIGVNYRKIIDSSDMSATYKSGDVEKNEVSSDSPLAKPISYVSDCISYVLGGVKLSNAGDMPLLLAKSIKERKSFNKIRVKNEKVEN